MPTAVQEVEHRARLRADYLWWHRAQARTGDLDPTYPVLRHLGRSLALSPDDLAWLVLLHVTYYHLGSALRAFSELPTPAAPTERLLRLPTGTERRGHRSPARMESHWRALLGAFDAWGGPRALLTAAHDGTDGWTELNLRIERVHGNGRWAAYKTAELAQKVLAEPVTVADAGHAHSSGPRQGLNLLHPGLPSDHGPRTVAYLDRLTSDLAAELSEPDLGAVETSLCDFHGLATGRYYLGHDIDAMQEQLAAVYSDLTNAAVLARLHTLDLSYLGEVGGWVGPDRDRKRAYLRTGAMVTRP